MKANNSLRINMPRALELISFFSRSWSDLSDIRLIRVCHNEGKLYFNLRNYKKVVSKFGDSGLLTRVGGGDFASYITEYTPIEHIFCIIMHGSKHRTRTV